MMILRMACLWGLLSRSPPSNKAGHEGPFANATPLRKQVYTRMWGLGGEQKGWGDTQPSREHIDNQKGPRFHSQHWCRALKEKQKYQRVKQKSSLCRVKNSAQTAVTTEAHTHIPSLTKHMKCRQARSATMLRGLRSSPTQSKEAPNQSRPLRFHTWEPSAGKRAGLPGICSS